MAPQTALSVLYFLACIQHIQSVGFHLPPPESFSHSCTPLGSWAVIGNVTLTEADAEFYSTNLTLKINDKNLCNIDLASCPELSGSMTSWANSPNVCACVSRFSEDDYSIYIRQETRSSDVGGLLTIIVPGQEKYGALQATHDIGHIPSGTNGNGGITYQIDSGHPVALDSVQNITVCSGQPVMITVCTPDAHPGTVLKLSEFHQTMSTSDPCIHIMDKFNFNTTNSAPVVFTYDEGAGCPFREKFVFNVQEKTIGCMTAASSTPAPTPLATTASPTAPCPDTPSSPARQEVTLNNNIRALCDTWTSGGNWVVIQRRVKGDVDFYRSWAEYMAGFGNLTGDYWLGLQDIHTICPPSKPCSFRVDLKDDRKGSTRYGQTLWAEYSSFSLGGYTEKYRLSLSGYNTSSSLVDGMGHHKGIPFSTYDRDNDNADSDNCARHYHGGWWYNSCHWSNLNGLWGVPSVLGMRWYDYGKQPAIYATYSEIKVRMHA